MHDAVDSRVGLDFIVESSEYVGKLAAALDSPNIVVKKQVFELLSALCVYNEEGRSRALNTLEAHQKLKSHKYRLAVVVEELERASEVGYQTALVAFVNCLVISEPRLSERVRLRNELVGCRLVAALNNLRITAQKEPELHVQLDVWDEQRDSDEAHVLRGERGIDLSSHQDVFFAVLRRVTDTPQEVPFLGILQHLLRIDPKEAISDLVWDAAERLVHRATLLEDREDAARLLRAPSSKYLAGQCGHCQQHRGSLDAAAAAAITSGSQPRKPSLPSSPPPPPPPPGGSTSPGVVRPTAPPPPPPPGIPPPPPAQAHPSSKSFQETVIPPPPPKEQLSEKLPQQETPVPRMKMKTINWNKIPNERVVGKPNIWAIVARSHQHSPKDDLDWSEMEGLFCQNIPPGSPRPARAAERGSEKIPRREAPEVTLLDGKRSLNVNIFLKQFRSSNEDIVRLVKEGDHEEVGAEKLRGLLKILPEVDELDMLKAYDGDPDRLGNAERFLLQLTAVPNHKLRIESMLLKEEFAANMTYLEPSIGAMLQAGEQLMSHQVLHEVLYMVLVAGNFLNWGGYAGDAAGVRLSSLHKLADIRANKPNMNLMHYVATQAERRGRGLLTFPDDLVVLDDASKTTADQLLNEIGALETRVKKIRRVVQLPNTESDIKAQMDDFLHMAERGVASLQRDMAQLEEVRRRLADFFCEDVGSFKLEECFRVLHGFCTRFRQAVAENARRKVQEEQANARRRQREELMAARRRYQAAVATAGTPTSDVEADFAAFVAKKKLANGNSLTSEDELSVLGSPSLGRRRIGSFNGGHDERSPDVTPNGSLRRRRSRVLSEEDEGNLMEFLRASGHDSNRERKSWGSLDRSWARRVRGSGPRKRPALLSADFSQERERPSSPSPLAEQPPAEEVEEPKPREWRQKIESWLQASDNDNNRTIRRATNRRSFELEGGENTLDTLPEGRTIRSSQTNYRRVYPDWKPSTAIDRTDVVGVIEAIQDAESQQKNQIKEQDKSAWRKSTLNSTGEIPSDRAELIATLGDRQPTDRLTLYMRRTPNRSEIDADNIETPPVQRRILPTERREPIPPPQCRRLLSRPSRELPPSPEEPEPTADGHFDRFSLARRTRRYKRPSDSSNSISETSPQTSTTPVESQQVTIRTTEQIADVEPVNVKPTTPVIPVKEKESRLRNWQDRLGPKNRSGRQSTGIDQEHVRAALRINNVHATRTGKEHERDEGFEETQSLMSESPSQGTSSDAPDGETCRKSEANSTEVPSTVQIPQRKNTENRRSVIPRRSATIGGTTRTTGTVPSSTPRRIVPVVRAPSRTSLLGSRSSLSSTASASTVRRMPISTTSSLRSTQVTTGVSSNVGAKSAARVALRPPKSGGAPAFMRPTTASATKTYIANTGGRVGPFRSTQVK